MNPTKTLQTSRRSNLELLRIVAMLMVLAVHADYVVLGIPSGENFAIAPGASLVRVIFESIGILGVNIFVAISGWFQIKPTAERFSKFCFQCLYFSVGIFLIATLLGDGGFNFHSVPKTILLTAYWFVISYMGLFILSPLINDFLRTSPASRQRKFLIAFFVFQTIYTKDNTASFINMGYSTFSFIGIYVLANYARHHIASRLNVAHLLLISLLTIILNTAIGIADPILGIGAGSTILMSYTNPLNILGSVSSVMLFSKLSIPQSRFINFISASAFAVYLFHVHPTVYPIFSRFVKDIYGQFDGIICLTVMAMFFIAVFAVAVLLDQPRKWAWECLDSITFVKRRLSCKSPL